MVMWLTYIKVVTREFKVHEMKLLSNRCSLQWLVILIHFVDPPLALQCLVIADVGKPRCLLQV